jgi:serine protein kinase
MEMGTYGQTFSLLNELRSVQVQRRIERERTREVIPFGEYLAKVESGKELYFLSPHERLYRTIVSRGIDYITVKDNPRVANMYGLKEGEVLERYSVFEEEFVGIADVIQKIVSYLHGPISLPETSEFYRQALVLIGPTGGAKSRFVDKLVRLLEESGPMWRLYGCPNNDHPFALIPRRLRPLIDDDKEERALRELDLSEEEIKLRKHFKKLGIYIDYDLCVICRHRLLNGWPEVRLSWAPGGLSGPIAIETYPVERTEFSKRSMTGYFEVPLTGEDEIDTSQLIGKVDIAKMPLYKSEADPRVLALIGGFNRANQGIIEFPEIFKRSRQALKILIGGTQDKIVPLPESYGMVSTNALIIGHSNWEEFNRFRSKGARNEALMRRFVMVYFRYNLQLSEEVRLLESRVKVKPVKDIFDFAPHTLEVIAALAILSRYKSVPEISMLQKLAVYDGKRVVTEKNKELKIEDVKHEEDGLEEAISFREEMKLIERMLYLRRVQERSIDKPSNEKISVIPKDALDLLPYMVEDVCKAQSFSEERRKQLLEYIQLVRERYNLQLLRELKGILIPEISKWTNDIFRKYIEQCELWLKWKSKGGQNQNKPETLDEDYLIRIEKNVHGAVQNATEFRKRRVALFLQQEENKGKGNVTYKDLGEELAQAFETYAFERFMEWFRLIKSKDANEASEEERREYQRVIDAMKKIGYSDITAPKVLDYFLEYVMPSVK